MYRFRDELVADGAQIMKKPYKYLACCSAFVSKSEKDQWGVLVFTKASAKRVGVVTHEFFHAVNYWFKYQKKNNVYEEADEPFAYMLGHLVKDYWNAWHKLPKNYKK